MTVVLKLEKETLITYCVISSCYYSIGVQALVMKVKKHSEKKGTKYKYKEGQTNGYRY